MNRTFSNLLVSDMQDNDDDKDEVKRIRKSLDRVSTKRIKDNQSQNKAYFNAIIGLRDRYIKDRKLPASIEVKVLVVFKKLVKSGWIVGADELR